jgi:phosphohistidine phosphatase SixA
MGKTLVLLRHSLKNGRVLSTAGHALAVKQGEVLQKEVDWSKVKVLACSTMIRSAQTLMAMLAVFGLPIGRKQLEVSEFFNLESVEEMYLPPTRWLSGARMPSPAS